MFRASYFTAVSLSFLLVAGCSDDDEPKTTKTDSAVSDSKVTTGDGPTSSGEGGAPTEDSQVNLVEISGGVFDGQDGTTHLEGARVFVVGATPAIETTSDSEGAFTLMVPAGAAVTIRAEMNDYLSGQVQRMISEEDNPTLELPLNTPGFIDTLLGQAGLPARDSEKGLVVVTFNDAEGGEKAVLSANNDGTFSINESSGEAFATDTITAESVDVLVFSNVVTGTTAVTLSATAGSCSLRQIEISEYPVDAGVLTIISADCAS